MVTDDAVSGVPYRTYQRRRLFAAVAAWAVAIFEVSSGFALTRLAGAGVAAVVVLIAGLGLMLAAFAVGVALIVGMFVCPYLFARDCLRHER